MLSFPKGTVSVFKVIFFFKERHPRFTTVPFEPLTNHQGHRERSVHNSNSHFANFRKLKI